MKRTLLFTLVGGLLFFSFPVQAQLTKADQAPRSVPPAKTVRTAEPRSQNTLLNENFQGVSPPALPAGWTSESPEGTFVTGDSEDANEGGYFPVPERPGNLFAMANDDVCNCDMSDIKLETPELDFSGQTDMALRFDAYHDKNWGGGDAQVEVSTDGGTSWTLVKVLDDAFQWQHYVISLAAYDNEPSVTIRFRWDDGGTWSSGFAVDNVVVDELIDNDLRTKDVFTTDMRRALEYSRIPLSHTHPMTVGSYVQNNGRAVQPNVIMDVTIDEGGTQVYSGTSSSIASLDSLETDSLWLNTGYQPQTMERYTVTTTVNSDSTEGYPSDNAMTDSVRVTCDEFGRDAGYYDEGMISSDSTFRAGNLYESFQQATVLHSFRVVLADSTAPGATLQGTLFRWASDSGKFLPVAQTDTHQVASGEVSTSGQEKWLGLSFPAPVTLDSGAIYAAMAGSNGGKVAIATSGYGPKGTAYRYASSWQPLTRIPMVRMVVPGLQPQLPKDTLLCSADTITLDAGAGFDSYSWNTGKATRTLEVDSFGIYEVTVTKDGCTTTDSVRVRNKFSLQFTTDSVSCFGGMDGRASVQPQNGAAPFSYDWNGMGNDDTLAGLSSGYYKITVTDDSGCARMDSAWVPGPDSLKAGMGREEVTCNGDGDGVAFSVPSGGTPPYAWSWAAGGNNDSLTGLASGKHYEVTVTDAKGCTVTDSVYIDEPDSLTVQPTATGVTCHGGADGQVMANVNGGTPPYAYSWTGTSGQDTVKGLSAGWYEVTVTDARECSDTGSAQVQEPAAPITFTSASQAPSSCGSLDGEVSVDPSGGNPPYSYDWMPGGQTNDTATGLAAGSYEVMVTDANGCDADTIVVLNDPGAPILMQDTVAAVTCAGATDGMAAVEASGGVKPYGYSWSPSGGNDSLATGLDGGMYTVEVIDDQGCKGFLNLTVEEPDSLTLSFTSVDVECPGQSTGSLKADVSGGTMPYDLLWSTGAKTDSIGNLSPGTYSLSVTDSNGCVKTGTDTVQQPDPFDPGTTIRDVKCHGNASGRIDLAPSGGTPPYQFVWNAGGTGDSLTGLTAGSYQVAVGDAVGCSYPYTFTVQEPDPLEIKAIITDSTMYGMIEVQVMGGTKPYTYAWDPSGATTQDLDSITMSGKYQLTVTDSNQCTLLDSFQVQDVRVLENASEEQEWRLYPNPSSGTVYLEAAEKVREKVSIEVRDMRGRLLQRAESQHFPYRIDVKGSPPGSYWLLLESEKSRQALRFELQ